MTPSDDLPAVHRKTHSWEIVTISLAALYIVGGALLLWLVPEPLLENWLPGSTVEDRGKLLGSAAQIVLFGLGGLIATVGVTLSVLRHREELAAGERDAQRRSDEVAKEVARRDEAEMQRRSDAEREMRARFVTAVGLLSASESIKRTAALYALAALADDWDSHGRGDEVQVCIDVLCGYLRAPLPDGVEETTASDKEVKRTGYSLIAQRLRKKSHHSWSNRRITLSKAHIDFLVDLEAVTMNFGGELYLDQVTVNDGGEIYLDGATINAGALVWLAGATINDGGKVDLGGAKINDGQVNFTYARISSGASLSLSRANISGSGKVIFNGASVEAEGVELYHATFEDNGPVTLPDRRKLLPLAGDDDGFLFR